MDAGQTRPEQFNEPTDVGAEDRIESDFNERVAAVTDNWLSQHIPQDVLYHYTTGEGLLGILEHRALRASDARYLNDPGETAYGYGIVKDVLLEAANDDDYFGAIFGSIGPLVDLGFIGPASNMESVAYAHVTCFCEKPDLLSQWRGYGHGATGYSLGFRTEGLCGATWNMPSVGFPIAKPHQPVLRRVIYDVNRQREHVRGVVNAYRDIPRVKHGHFLAAVSMQREIFSGLLAEYAHCFKHPDFAEEHEWRLIYFPIGVEQGFVPTHRFLKPYVNIQLANNPAFPLVAVHVGPGLDKELAQNSVRAALRRFGFPVASAVDVSTSTTPYRT